MCARASERGGREGESERKEGGEEGKKEGGEAEEERRRVFAEEDVAAPVQKLQRRAAEPNRGGRHEPDREQVTAAAAELLSGVQPGGRGGARGGRGAPPQVLLWGVGCQAAVRTRPPRYRRKSGGLSSSSSPRGRLRLTFSRC